MSVVSVFETFGTGFGNVVMIVVKPVILLSERETGISQARTLRDRRRQAAPLVAAFLLRYLRLLGWFLSALAGNLTMAFFCAIETMI